MVAPSLIIGTVMTFGLLFPLRWLMPSEGKVEKKMVARESALLLKGQN